LLQNGKYQAKREWQAIVYDIRTCFWEDADDIAGRLLGLRLVGVLPTRHKDGEGTKFPRW